MAADYLGVTTQTVMRYYRLVAMPEGLKEMVDQGILPSGAAGEIVRNTYDGRAGRRVPAGDDRTRIMVPWP